MQWWVRMMDIMISGWVHKYFRAELAVRGASGLYFNKALKGHGGLRGLCYLAPVPSGSGTESRGQRLIFHTNNH